MNERFVENIYKTIIVEGISVYKNLLEKTDSNKATDKYWISALQLYKNLSGEDKQKMLDFAELIMIDTISSVFGILDGSSTLSEELFEFNVTINGSSTENELHHTFLAFVEGNSN